MSHAGWGGIVAVRIFASVVVSVCALGSASLLVLGCESATHENIDRWMITEKGPGKLEDAIGDTDLDADLRAHAAQNLIRMDRWEAVGGTFEAMDANQRAVVLDELIPRLWADARVEGEMSEPSPGQISAKDALFDLRQYAEGKHRGAIDEHLADWLTGGYYAGRARQGRIRGSRIMRTIGPPAAPKLLQVAKSIIGQAPDAQGKTPKIEDALLVGLAATGSPQAVDFIISLMSLESNDPTLPQRAFDALHQGYVQNRGLFEVADGAALVPQIDRLVEIAKNETLPSRMINDSIQLLGTTGAKNCIVPLVGLITFPHENEKFRWVAANSALQCGKAKAIVPVADAIPEKGSYERRELAGALWEPMAVFDDKKAVAEQARILLEAKSWVARVIGVELLGELAMAATASADVARIQRLSGDETPLSGWWGDQDGVANSERKPVPTLGERASEVAAKLAKLASGGGK